MCTSRPPLTFEGKLTRVSPPLPLVIIAQHWPSAFVVALSLGLEIDCLYVNPRFIDVCTQVAGGCMVGRILDVDLVFRRGFSAQHVFVVSGTERFFDLVYSQLGRDARFIWSFEQPFRGVPQRKWKKTLASVATSARRRDLVPVVFPHTAYGGGTNASYLLVFSSSFRFAWKTFLHPQNVRRSIKHFWEYASSGSMTVCRDALPPATSPPHRVLNFNDSLRFEGLLDVRNTFCHVLGPSVYHPGSTISRRLTSTELRRLFDVPISWDNALSSFKTSQQSPLPFEAAISPSILAAAFRHVWGMDGGSIDSIDSTPDFTSLSSGFEEKEGDSSIHSMDEGSDAGSSPIVYNTNISNFCDYDSDADSLMPHQKRCPIMPGGSAHAEVVDWELLGDEDTEQLSQSTTVSTSSWTSCSGHSRLSEISIPSGTCINSDDDSVSIASQATLITSPKNSPSRSHCLPRDFGSNHQGHHRFEGG